MWTWTAIDADTKLIPSWFIGGRDSDAAIIFMDDLRSRLANRVQLTSDGHKAYLEAIEGAFGADVDYAQLVKLYGPSSELAKGRARLNASVLARPRLRATRTRTISARHMPSVQTSAFGCTLAALLG